MANCLIIPYAAILSDDARTLTLTWGEALETDSALTDIEMTDVLLDWIEVRVAENPAAYLWWIATDRYLSRKRQQDKPDVD